MGREFIPLFEDWATTYDATVHGADKQYAAVFKGYDSILDSIVALSGSNVLEFGPGTGNLTAKLAGANKKVFGVEPSPSMRKLAADKLSDKAVFSDGDFLEFPAPPFQIDTIVSSYAFHHLTDEEKRTAVKQYGAILQKHDKIVFADTVFKDHEAYDEAIKKSNPKRLSSISGRFKDGTLSDTRDNEKHLFRRGICRAVYAAEMTLSG